MLASCRPRGRAQLGQKIIKWLWGATARISGEDLMVPPSLYVSDRISPGNKTSCDELLQTGIADPMKMMAVSLMAVLNNSITSRIQSPQNIVPHLQE